MDVDEKTLRHRALRLEAAKLFVSILTPLVLIWLTSLVNSAIQERGAALDREKQILSEKQKIYAELGRTLNIIYVYVADIGDFRAYTPPQIVDYKRNADRQFYSYRPYWSEETENHYNQFMNAAFRTYTGPGQPAKIRASPPEKIAAYAYDNKEWDSDWNDYFVGEYDKDISTKYYELVTAMLSDTVTPVTRRLANIDKARAAGR